MAQTPVRELTLPRLISPRDILPRLHATSRRQVLRDLVRLACERRGLDCGGVQTALSAQPDLPSFGPARGVAMPHACIAGLGSPSAFLARLDRAIPFASADGEPVQIVALVLAPEDRPSTLLRTMACLARCLRDRTVRTSILAARDADAIFSVLATEEWRTSSPD